MNKFRKKILSISLMLILIFNTTLVYGAGETGNTTPIAGLTADVMKNSKIDFTVYTDYSGQKLADLTTKLSTFKANAFSKGSDFQYSIVNDKTKVSTYTDNKFKFYYRADGTAIVIKPNGTVWVKGTNDKGQLGLGDTVKRDNFTQIPGITDAWRVFVRNNSVFLIKKDLSVYFWGDNDVYRPNPEDTTAKSFLVPTKLSNLQGTTKICFSYAESTAMSRGCFLGLKSDGTVLTWGYGVQNGTYNVLPVTTLPIGNDNKDLTANTSIVAVLKSDGRVYNPEQSIYIPNMNNIASIESTIATCVGVTIGGTVWAYTSQTKVYGDNFRFCGMSTDAIDYQANYGYAIGVGDNVADAYYSNGSYINYKKTDGTIWVPYYHTINLISGVKQATGINNVCCGYDGYFLQTNGDIKTIGNNGGNPTASIVNSIDLNSVTPYVYDIYGANLSQPTLREDATHCALLLSDGAGSDYSKPYGDYYSFGTLNKSFMYYLINNNFKSYADTPASNLNYKLNSSQQVSIQDILNNIESKLSIDSTTTGSLSQVDNILSDVYNNFVVSSLSHLGTANERKANITVLTDYSGSKLSTLQQTISTQKSYLYTQGVNADIQVYNSSKLLEKQAYTADIINRLTKNYYADKTGILYQYNSSTKKYDINTGITNVKQVAEANSNVFIVKNDQTAYSWGNNGLGTLGLGITNLNYQNTISNPGKIPLDNVIKISADTYHTMFLCSNSDVYACGYNNAGQINASASQNLTYFTPIKIGTGAKDIKAIGSMSYALKGSLLFHWGRTTGDVINDEVQYTNDVCNGNTNTLDVLTGFPVLTTDKDYTIFTYIPHGSNPYPGAYARWIKAKQKDNGNDLMNIISSSSVGNSTYLIDGDGFVWYLEHPYSNSYVGTKVSTINNALCFADTGYGKCIVKKDGTLYHIDGNGYSGDLGTFTKIEGLNLDRTVEYLDLTKLYNSNIKKGEENYCILVSDGTSTDFTKPFNTYYSFGTLNNEFKAFCLNNNVECKVITPAANYDYILKPPDIGVSSQDISLRQLVDATGGKLYSSGEIGKALTEISYKRVQVNILTDYTGQKISNLTSTVNQTKSNLYSNGVDIKFNIVDGNNATFLSSKIVDICPYENKTLFLTDTGSVYGCGNDPYTTILNTVNVTTPELINLPAKIKKMALGLNHAVFLDVDGNVWTMGANNYGQLGNGGMGDTVIKRNNPVKVFTNAANVFAIDNTTFVQGKDGTLYGCGSDTESLLNGSSHMTPQTSFVNIVNMSKGDYIIRPYIYGDGTRGALSVNKTTGKAYIWGHFYDSSSSKCTITGGGSELPIDGAVDISEGDNYNRINVLDKYGNLCLIDIVTVMPLNIRYLGSIQSNVTQITSTPMFVLKNDGFIYNTFGIKLNSSNSSNISKIYAYSNGNSVAYAIDNNGKCYAWGVGTYGQMANGSTNNNDTFQPISEFAKFKVVNATAAMNLPLSNNADRYFMYISDGQSNNVDDTFGNYYSFGNLNNNLKTYLVNNKFNIFAITSPVNYDYIFNSAIQELTIRQLVNSSPGEGKLYGLGEYKKSLQYIEDKYSFPETPKAGYIEINDTLLYNKIYDDYEKDCNAANEEYAERWRYIHDPDVFENNQGIIADSNVWTGLSTTKVTKKKFDKVGKYTISYQAQDDPTLDARFANYKMQSSGQDQLDVYVNRRPIAKFSYIKSGSTLAITNRSYDLDHYSHAAHGIVQNQFKYKATDDDTWTMGQPTTIQVDKTYIITLKVKDEDGFVSLPYTLMVGKDINNPPVAQFTLDVPYMNSVIKTVDSSYDPDSDPLVEHKWAIKYKDGAWKYFDTLPNSLVDAGFTEAGQYTFGLRVKDDPTARNTALTPLYSNWYYVSVNVNYDLQLTASTKRVTKVVSGIPTLISTSTFKAGNGVVVVAKTLGGAYKVDAYLVINKDFTPALLSPDIALATPPQNEMDWHTRHKRSEGYEVNTVIPIGTKNGTYKIVVTAYKKKPDGTDLTKTVELPIVVNDSIDIKSEIIMP